MSLVRLKSNDKVSFLTQNNKIKNEKGKNEKAKIDIDKSE